mgnify:CR=1 FL=1
MFHAAIGEEFVFRIVPSLLFRDFWIMRFVISAVVFSGLHSIPFFTKSINTTLYETLLTVGSTFIMGCVLSMLESYFTSPIIWYMVCCLIHVTNNLVVLHTVNRSIKYHPGSSNGFVVKLNT